VILKGVIKLTQIQVGVKIMPHTEIAYIKKIQEYADFFEIYAGPTVDLRDERLSALNIPVSVVHSAYLDDGVNFANPKRSQINRVLLQKAQKIADHFRSTKIVFHPEQVEDKFCSNKSLIKFLNKNYDERLLMENMPDATDGLLHLGRNYEEIIEIVSETGVKTCLDFTHAAEFVARHMSDRNGFSPNNFIKKLLALKPPHFHLADTNLDLVFNKNYSEVHLNLWEGNMGNIDFIKACFLKIPGAAVTLETPQQDLQKQIKEINYLKSIH
jgi:hypothetical protein